MPSSQTPLFTDKHLEAFGRIITMYAHTESAIKLALSGVLHLHLYEVLILTEPYGALDLRNVTKSLAKTNLPDPLAEKLCWLVGQLGSYSALRNAIAHHRWTHGDRPTAVRPANIDIRSGKPLTKGYDEGEEDFTLDELGEKANALDDLHEAVRQFIRESGLWEVIAKKMDLAKAEMDALLGADATPSSSAPDDTHS